ncbi:unknown protein [Microcystis aeruginosa NIES-843]|uniref:Uncharacterized protein n=1 Tax=Microcystis aeruginosa (strain NIES-843 / IAM M-2473) TaxID=449447 RepID=B0JNW5_MICAN|nr:unknown protein [Microcystis aeruginosa NIES-843]
MSKKLFRFNISTHIFGKRSFSSKEQLASFYQGLISNPRRGKGFKAQGLKMHRVTQFLDFSSGL